jgi:peptidoglycan-associated lipoprotein
MRTGRYLVFAAARETKKKTDWRTLNGGWWPAKARVGSRGHNYFTGAEVGVMLKLKPGVVRIVLEAFVVTFLLTGCSSCTSKTPRQHWWEFWKPKAPTSQYNSDAFPGGAPTTTPGGAAGESTGIPGEEGKFGLSQVRGPKAGTATANSALPTVYFEYDKSQLSQSEKEVLDRSAQYLKENPTMMVQIEGHCDERGSPEYNFNLGQKRADSVREYLVSKGIEANRLVTISYGEDRPAVQGHDEKAWAMNRRAQFLSY